MREKTCCFTGRRKIPPEQYESIARRLRIEVRRLIERGIIYFGAGGALGFDTMAALTVLSLKAEYPQIRLILVLPCPEQTRGWKSEDIAVYENIKVQCDKFVYTSQSYTGGCIMVRNRHLVDHSSICICYLSEPTGGTAYTVKYARSKGLSVINLASISN